MQYRATTHVKNQDDRHGHGLIIVHVPLLGPEVYAGRLWLTDNDYHSSLQTNVEAVSQ